jgi:ElaB/YqjD/DUF883 family membrane-anchored ribosome-binding protein
MAEARAREIKQLKQDLAKVKGENDRLLAEMCRTDEDRAEAAREIQRLGLSLKEAKTQARSLEDQVAKSRMALAECQEAGRSARATGGGERGRAAQRWRKFEEQLNQKDRDLLQTRAAIDELKQLKEQAEARVAQSSRARALRLRNFAPPCSRSAIAEPAIRRPEAVSAVTEQARSRRASREALAGKACRFGGEGRDHRRPELRQESHLQSPDRPLRDHGELSLHDGRGRGSAARDQRPGGRSFRHAGDHRVGARVRGRGDDPRGCCGTTRPT